MSMECHWVVKAVNIDGFNKLRSLLPEISNISGVRFHYDESSSVDFTFLPKFRIKIGKFSIYPIPKRLYPVIGI